MGLDIDTTKSLRGNAALERLVRAVERAADHDELASVEWKSALDLTTAHGRFHVARCILAMANRDPKVATREFDGYGYVVVGAEPGPIAGIVSADPATYVGPINQYVGSDDNGPAWAPTHVPIDNATVAVFIVEPPEPGHRAWPLRKTYRDATGKGADEGTVFVRGPGRTAPANAAEMDMLSRRAAAAGHATPDIDVELEGDLPLSWFDEATLDDAIATWSRRRAWSRIRAARELDAAQNRSDPEPTGTTDGPYGLGQLGTGAAIAGMLADAARTQRELERAMRQAASANVLGTFGLTNKPDQRTLEAFEAEVDHWETKLTAAARDSFDDIYHSRGHGEVVMRVTNRSNRFLENVRVKASFPWHAASASDDEPRPGRLPSPPRPFGEPEPDDSPFARMLRGDMLLTPFPSGLDVLDYGTDLGRRTWVENGSISIVFELDELRPHDSDTSDTIWIRLPARPDGGLLEGTWELTAKGMHAIVRGPIAVPTTEVPVDIADLLSRAITG